jgi:hypothetical protein
LSAVSTKLIGRGVRAIGLGVDKHEGRNEGRAALLVQAARRLGRRHVFARDQRDAERFFDSPVLFEARLKQVDPDRILRQRPAGLPGVQVEGWGAAAEHSEHGLSRARRRSRRQEGQRAARPPPMKLASWTPAGAFALSVPGAYGRALA